MHAPVYEATYGLDKKHPLALYECLVPKLLDYQHKEPVEFEIENDELKTEVALLKDQNKALLKDLDRVRWYQMQQEENVDTKTIIANFERAQKRIKRLEEDLEKGDAKYEDEVKKAKDKFDQCFAKLVRVNEDIVKPTIEEMKELQKEKLHYKELYFDILKNFQVMSAILRLPTMIHQFH